MHPETWSTFQLLVQYIKYLGHAAVNLFQIVSPISDQAEQKWSAF